MNGTIQWRIDQIGARFDAVATDTAGDILAAGSILNSDASDQDLIVVKLDSASGAELWRTVISGAISRVDEYGDLARAVAVDGKGDICVGGLLSNDAVSPTDYFVAKLDGATGSELWRQQLRGTGGHGSYVNSIALDPNGDVVAGGGMHILPDWIHMVVVKFASSDGSQLWRQDYDPYPGAVHVTYSVAIDPAGDIMTADWLGSSISSVIKLSGLTGGLLWRYDSRITESRQVATEEAGPYRSMLRVIRSQSVPPWLMEPHTPSSRLQSYRVIRAKNLAAHRRFHWLRRSAEAVAVGPGGNVAIAGFVEPRQNGVCVGTQRNDYAVFWWSGFVGVDLLQAAVAASSWR